MFKLLVFLCAGLFATMYVLGRDGGPVRDGLAGRVTPLMQDADSPEREAAPRVILAAATKPAAGCETCTRAGGGSAARTRARGRDRRARY